MTATNNSAHPNNRFDEFSPKKLILQALDINRTVLQKWKLILLFTLLAGTIGVVYSLRKKPNYVAEITFALDEGAMPNPRGGFAALQQELGIYSPNLEAGGVFSSIINIIELIKSRFLIDKTLRNTVLIGGKRYSFLDYFLEAQNLREKWTKNTKYADQSFPLNKKDYADTIFENNIIRMSHDLITAKMINVSAKGKGTTIVSVLLISENELFSKYFLEELIHEVTKYYLESKTQRSKLNLDFIQKRVDSTRRAYNSSLYGRASFTDAHVNPALQISVIPTEKKQTDVEILRTSYIELVKDLESAKTALMKDTPLFQYLDTPILPLKKLQSSWLKFLLISSILGAIASYGFFTARLIWRRILSVE
jgi:Chain length determinant protein